ncbi:MAG: beta-hexosaminidase [Oscillospiraceae bacterium]|nr:beta-hexosaminidase [Oscillospiraceae bacterium]
MMKDFWKLPLMLLPAACMAILCSCDLGEAIAPMTDDSRVIEYPEGALTTTETTVTTTTTNVYTPPDDPQLIDLLDSMTLEQKAAQMMLVGCTDQTVGDYVCANGAGGLCLFAQPFTCKTADEVRAMTAGFQAAADIPLLLSVDEEGGGVCRVSLNPNLRETNFWSPRFLFNQGGWELIRSDTDEKADFLLDLGLNVNLAPVCDVPFGEGDFIYPRCFSTDADEVSEYVATVVGIMKEHRLGSTLKHFPGYGGSADTHLNMAFDGREYAEFESRDLLPFLAGMEAGADSVMVTHNIIECMDSEQPASLSPEVHRILREECGFRGVIITDDLNMNAITQFTGGQNPAVAAVLAGNDLLCYAEFDSSVQAITDAVRDGTIDEEQIDASVLRILYWKQSLGLLEDET